VPVRTWRVSCRDLRGIEHTVEVTAETVYEAVAQGLPVFCENIGVDEIGRGLTAFTYSDSAEMVADLFIEVRFRSARACLSFDLLQSQHGYALVRHVDMQRLASGQRCLTAIEVRRLPVRLVKLNCGGLVLDGVVKYHQKAARLPFD
jgi:hypothetical protein